MPFCDQCRKSWLKADLVVCPDRNCNFPLRQGEVALNQNSGFGTPNFQFSNQGLQNQGAVPFAAGHGPVYPQQFNQAMVNPYGVPQGAWGGNQTYGQQFQAPGTPAFQPQYPVQGQPAFPPTTSFAGQPQPANGNQPQAPPNPTASANVASAKNNKRKAGTAGLDDGQNQNTKKGTQPGQGQQAKFNAPQSANQRVWCLHHHNSRHETPPSGQSCGHLHNSSSIPIKPVNMCWSPLDEENLERIMSHNAPPTNLAEVMWYLTALEKHIHGGYWTFVKSRDEALKGISHWLTFHASKDVQGYFSTLFVDCNVLTESYCGQLLGVLVNARKFLVHEPMKQILAQQGYQGEPTFKEVTHVLLHEWDGDSPPIREVDFKQYLVTPLQELAISHNDSLVHKFVVKVQLERCPEEIMRSPILRMIFEQPVFWTIQSLAKEAFARSGVWLFYYPDINRRYVRVQRAVAGR
ncbi:hypothetical protein H2200_006379 [Cladophialophora chaetospira]|uniref:Uncharacterized protein n=1 Tax=Cladophialophora chaetospira TaxID=386627 RepID=A0AA39CHN5_9EURO|nr:hypothetical protein H2200_006379 [Cladophialophora chaetospira]